MEAKFTSWQSMPIAPSLMMMHRGIGSRMGVRTREKEKRLATRQDAPQDPLTIADAGDVLEEGSLGRMINPHTSATSSILVKLGQDA